MEKSNPSRLIVYCPSIPPKDEELALSKYSTTWSIIFHSDFEKLEENAYGGKPGSFLVLSFK